MKQRPLDTRRQSLENEFFQQQDEELRTRLRQQRERDEDRIGIAMLLGIDDHETCELILDAGVEPESWIALCLVPLVEVAWADGGVSSAEREAIVGAAAAHGVVEGSPAAAVLERWLARRPGPALHEAWVQYMSAIGKLVGPTTLSVIQNETLGTTKRVAKAAASRLGRERGISAAEARVLDELGRVFMSPGSDDQRRSPDDSDARRPPSR